MNTKNIIIIIVILLIIGAGYFLFMFDKIPGGTNTGTTTPNVLTELPPGLEIPDLDRKIVIPESVSEEIGEKTTDQIKSIREDLKDNPNNLAPWLDLGILYKTIEDNEGAEEVWLFVTKIRPNDWIAYHNLADLYGYYLQEPQKAEEYILTALEKAPRDVQIYVKAYEIYKDVVGDVHPMKKIVEDGLKELPGDETLLSIQAVLEKQ